MSKDITGIKKMKVERARRESLQDKETFTEFTKRFTAENFVDQVSELLSFLLDRNCMRSVRILMTIYNYSLFLDDVVNNSKNASVECYK